MPNVIGGTGVLVTVRLARRKPKMTKRLLGGFRYGLLHPRASMYIVIIDTGIHRDGKRSAAVQVRVIGIEASEIQDTLRMIMNAPCIATANGSESSFLQHRMDSFS